MPEPILVNPPVPETAWRFKSRFSRLFKVAEPVRVADWKFTLGNPCPNTLGLEVVAVATFSVLAPILRFLNPRRFCPSKVRGSGSNWINPLLSNVRSEGTRNSV